MVCVDAFLRWNGRKGFFFNTILPWQKWTWSLGQSQEKRIQGTNEGSKQADPSTQLKGIFFLLFLILVLTKTKSKQLAQGLPSRSRFYFMISSIALSFYFFQELLQKTFVYSPRSFSFRSITAGSTRSACTCTHTNDLHTTHTTSQLTCHVKTFTEN